MSFPFHFLDISDSESSRSGSPDSTGSACSDDVMYDINDTNQSRRARTAISNWQRHQLEIMFENQRYPSGDKVEKMSVQLGLPQYVIKVRRKQVIPYIFFCIIDQTKWSKPGLHLSRKDRKHMPENM